ncbi:MAG: CRTAC1 family protein [Planctomycetes bacterium]|nr:CRTAC1 family protein [Planctomycetota bacterium]
MRPFHCALAGLASLVVGACGSGDDGSQAPPAPRANADSAHTPAPTGDLMDEARERGLIWTNLSGEPAKATVLEANGPGVAVLDLERDGDLDLVFSQGCATLADLLSGPGAELAIFANDGHGRFSRRPSPAVRGWWTGLAVGDLDNDGDQDLVAGGFGQLHSLLQNDAGELLPAADLLQGGDGARLVPGAARDAGRAPLWLTSLALLDGDRDGVLDLYAGAYLELDPLAPPRGSLGSGALAVPCKWKGHEVFCGPHGMPPQADRYYRGVGDGSFVESSASALPGHVAGYTLAVAPFDFEGDGDTDLYVANDSVANLLLINDGRARFTDVAYSAGVALSMDGRGEAGMGVAFGDVDRDGDFDFALTNFSGEPTALYFAHPRGFSNETFRFGLQRETRALLSWSVHLCDFDGDGWLELFTANGHVYPQADLPDTGTSYAQPDTLWRLVARGEERRLTALAPSGANSVLAAPTSSRGSAVGDFDGDGAPDLVIARIDGAPALGMNRFPHAQRIALRCLGPTRSERQSAANVGRTPADGTGARVTLVPDVPVADEHALLSQVFTAVGFQSASSAWLHFGLGAAPGYRSIRVQWPSGRVEELGPGAAGRRITLREGQGIVAEEPLP